MSYVFSVNQQPATGSVAMWQLISTLKTAGWSQIDSSDGTTQGASQVTNGGAGINGLGNTSAWVRIQAPTTTGGLYSQNREFIFQRGTTDLQWRVKYSAVGGFIGGVSSATITPTNRTADQYSQANQDATTSLRSGSTVGAGQSFTGDGQTLYSVRAYLKKAGTPTGSAYAKIYAHDGLYGTNSIPIGAALATSDAFSVSTLTTSYALIELKFTGSNQITLTNSTNYIISIEYSGGSAGNTLDVGTDTSTPSHGGNFSTWDGGTWTAVAGTDMCFYIATGIQDEVVLIGTGTDVTPTYSANWFTTNNTYRWHVGAGGADEGYSFYAFASYIGSVTLYNAIFLDVLSPGSYPSEDVDPAVVFMSPAATNNFLSYTDVFTLAAATSTEQPSSSGGPVYARAWLGPLGWAGNTTSASGGHNNVGVGITGYGGAGSALFLGGWQTYGMNNNPFTLLDTLLPCLWLRQPGRTAPTGYKGYSTLFYMCGTFRFFPTTLTVNTTRDRIYLYGAATASGYTLPWSGDMPIC